MKRQITTIIFTENQKKQLLQTDWHQTNTKTNAEP